MWQERASGGEYDGEESSAEHWDFHSAQELFLTSFEAIVSASDLSIDSMVEQVEAFLMAEAQKAGVVKLRRPFKPHNPN